MSRVVVVNPRLRLSTADMAELELHPDVQRLIAARTSLDASRRLSAAEVDRLLRHPDVAPALGVMVGQAVAKAVQIAVPHYARQAAADARQAAVNELAAPVAAAVAGAVVPAVAGRAVATVGRGIAEEAYRQGRADERRSAALASVTIPQDALKPDTDVVVIRRSPRKP